VHERVALLNRTIGPDVGSNIAKEAPLPGKRLAAAGDVVDRNLERVRRSTGGELHASGARRFQDVLFVGIESVNLDVEQLANRVGSMRPDVVVGREQLPHALDRPHHATALEIVEKRDREQGVAARRLVDRARDLRKAMPWPPRIEVLAESRLSEIGELDRRCLAVRGQLSDDLLERVGFAWFHRPERTEHQQARRVTPPPKHREQLRSGVIRPLKIFERDHDRYVHAQNLECVGQFPKHSGLRSTLHAGLQRRQTIIGDRAGKLVQPAWRSAREGLDNMVAARSAAQRGERTEYGQIGFAASVLLDARAACDECAVSSRVLEHGVDERGLSDASFTGHEDQLPLAIERALEMRA